MLRRWCTQADILTRAHLQRHRGTSPQCQGHGAWLGFGGRGGGCSWRSGWCARQHQERDTYALRWMGGPELRCPACGPASRPAAWRGRRPKPRQMGHAPGHAAWRGSARPTNGSGELRKDPFTPRCSRMSSTSRNVRGTSRPVSTATHRAHVSLHCCLHVCTAQMGLRSVFGK